MSVIIKHYIKLKALLNKDTITHFCNLKHLTEFLNVSSDKVEEGKTLVVLGTLVSHFHNLVVTLAKSSNTKAVPALLIIQHLSSLEGNGNVSTLQGKVKTGLLILDEMKGDLWEALLLQVGDDGLSDEVGFPHHLQHVVVSLLDEGVFEQVFCWVDGDHAVLALSIKAVHLVCSDSSNINWCVKCTDNAIVAIRKAVFDVVESSVDEDSVVVPGSTLDSDGFMDSAKLFQFFVSKNDALAAKECNHVSIVRPNGISNFISICFFVVLLLLVVVQVV